MIAPRWLALWALLALPLACSGPPEVRQASPAAEAV